MSGTWSPTALPTRPGLYINFQNAALNTINGGSRGIVALFQKAITGGTAAPNKFYTVSDTATAEGLFGSANCQSIEFILQGGAQSVLVYTLPVIDGTSVTETAAYTTAFNALSAGQNFDVFVFDGEMDSATQAQALTWMQSEKTLGNDFMVVFGGDSTSDADPSLGNTRSTTNKDDYVVNVINGIEIDGTVYTSGKAAPFIAGLIAGTGINKSITYSVLAGVEDVSPRLTNAQTNTALQAGSLVLTYDGEKVKVEQGLTTNITKIRTIRAKQQIAADIEKTGADSYVGKLDNTPGAQKALIGAVSAYLEKMAIANVLTNPVVTLDPNHPSTADSTFLAISYTTVDSMEKIYLTVTVS